MKKIVKKILVFFYKKVYNSYLFILVIKKPINTWILSKFVNKNAYFRDGMFCHDETNHKTEWFSEISVLGEKNAFI